MIIMGPAASGTFPFYTGSYRSVPDPAAEPYRQTDSKDRNSRSKLNDGRYWWR